MKQFIGRVKSLKQNNPDAFGQFLFAVTIMALNILQIIAFAVLALVFL